MSVTLTANAAVLTEKLEEAIQRGEGLVADPGDVDVLKPAYQTWDKRNQILLEGAFDAPGFLTVSPSNDYTSAFGLKYPLGPEIADDVNVDDLLHDLRAKIQRLRHLIENLDAYPSSALAGSELHVDAISTIFIVHGRDTAARTEVELLVRRATSVEPVILASQPNQGATLIEKLEKHLGGASFAIVLLTAEDVGRLNEHDALLQPRARQNVVLELGFAMGALGRSNVAILHEQGLELPSDINGVGYYPLDAEDHWKMSILGELQTAGFTIDLGRGVGS